MAAPCWRSLGIEAIRVGVQQRPPAKVWSHCAAPWSDLLLAESGYVVDDEQPEPGVWLNGIGNGLCPGAESLTLSLGAGGGVPIFGGQEHHDLTLVVGKNAIVPPRAGGRPF